MLNEIEEAKQYQIDIKKQYQDLAKKATKAEENYRNGKTISANGTEDFDEPIEVSIDKTVFRLSYRHFHNNLNGLERAMVMTARSLLDKSMPVADVKNTLYELYGKNCRPQYVLWENDQWKFYDALKAEKKKGKKKDDSGDENTREVTDSSDSSLFITYTFRKDQTADKTDEDLLSEMNKIEDKPAGDVRANMEEADPVDKPAANGQKVIISAGWAICYARAMQKALELEMWNHLLAIPTEKRLPFLEDNIPSAEWFDQQIADLFDKTAACVARLADTSPSEAAKEKLKAYKAALDAKTSKVSLPDTRDLRQKKVLDYTKEVLICIRQFHHADAAKTALQQSQTMNKVLNMLSKRVYGDLQPLFTAEFTDFEMKENNYKQLSYEKAIAMAYEAGALKRYYLVAAKKDAAAFQTNEADIDKMFEQYGFTVKNVQNKTKDSALDVALKLTAAFLLSKGESSRFYTPVNWTDIANWGYRNIRFDRDTDLEKKYRRTVNDTDMPLFQRARSENEDKNGNVSYLWINPDWMEEFGWIVVEEQDIENYAGKLYFRDDGSGNKLVCCEKYSPIEAAD